MNKYDQIESVKYVVDNSIHVKINERKIQEIIPFLSEEKRGGWLNLKYLDKEYTNEEKCRFLLFCEVLNFSYWGKPKWKIEYNGEWYSGYYALFYSLIKVLKSGINIFNTDFINDLTLEEFDKLLNGTTSVPMLKERFEVLKATAKEIEKLGSVYNLFLKAKSDIELLEIIVDNFIALRDISIYKGKEVYLFKRATLLVEDLFLNIKEIKDNIKNIDNLNGCADYKVPQVLRQIGILEYDDELSKIVDNELELAHDTDMEIEIRANMIYAVDLIHNSVKNNKSLNSVDIDNQLWLLSKAKDWKSKPYHLTRTIYY